MHLWRLEKAGRFPRRMKLGPNSVGWLESEIDEWIASRLTERDAVLRANNPSAALDGKGHSEPQTRGQ